MVKFLVKKLGLQTDGIMLMPGTLLTLKTRPPRRWTPYGHIVTGSEFEVATPDEPEGDGSEGNGGDGSEDDPATLEQLRRSYKTLTGEDADKRWKAARLTKEIEAYNG